jgi:nickel-dependent lactate racemase
VGRAARVAVLIDDTSRPTPASLAVDAILEQLAAAGVGDHRLVIVGAVGMHRPMGPADFARKLGARVAARVKTVSHHVDAACVLLGTTGFGTPVWVNRAVAEADLAIGVSLVAPHGLAAFSGGAKLVLPGVCNMTTVLHNHGEVPKSPGTPTGDGFTTRARMDMEEAADLARLEFSVNFVLNADLSVAGVFAGQHRPAYRQAAALAARLGTVPVGPGADVVVTSSYPKDSDLLTASRGLFAAVPFCRPGGAVLWYASCPEGRGQHHLILDNPDYLAKLQETYAAIGRRYDVTLVSPGLSAAEVRSVLPAEVKFAREFGPVLESWARRRPRASAYLLRAAPFLLAAGTR